MRLLPFAALLALSACVPTLTENDEVTLTCTDTCVLSAPAPITEAYVYVSGVIVSPYCVGAAASAPRACEVIGGFSDLDLPPGVSYGREVVLGSVDRVPVAGEAFVNLEGSKKSFRAELDR